jgi:hypothetical protein
MEDNMNLEVSTSLAISLFVYVMTAVLLGVVDWSFQILPDNTIMILSGFLGVAAFVISIWKSK